MKLKMEQVARVSSAEIALCGVTVIAGYNGTGKSTISKSLYALTDTFSDLPGKVRAEKERSAAHTLLAWETGRGVLRNGLADYSAAAKRIVSEQLTREKLDGILREELHRFPVGEGLWEQICAVLDRTAEKYERFIVERSFRAVFRDQINTLSSEAPARFLLEDGDCCAAASFVGNELSEMTPSPYFGRPAVYIGTLNVLDVVAQDPESFTYIDRLEELLHRECREEDLTFEEYRQTKENSETVREILRRITEGRIVREGKRMRFLDDRTRTNIDFSNLASGLKTFVIIQTLIENGSLTRGSTLIIDEPEVNLHPDWQLKFAEILVLLHEKLGITMLLNTHSPYFLRAIEIYLAEYGCAQHGRYYFTEEQEDRFLCRDVTGEPEVIYRALYEPLESL